MENMAKVARQFVNAFEAKHRDNGEAFHCLKDGSPEWISEAMFAAHDQGTMLPNDWTYRLAGNMADYMAEALERGESDESEIVIDAAGMVVPAYNHERLEWLASHAYRVQYVDDIMKEYANFSGGIIDAIGEAIEREAENIGFALWAAFEKECDNG